MRQLPCRTSSSRKLCPARIGIAVRQRVRNELLVSNDDFGPLLIKREDEVQVSPTDRRTITSITSVGLSKLLKLDGLRSTSPRRLSGVRDRSPITAPEIDAGCAKQSSRRKRPLRRA